MRPVHPNTVLDRARPLGPQPQAEAPAPSLAAAAATAAQPAHVGRWEWGALLFAIWVQQAAFIQVIQDWTGGAAPTDASGNPADPSASNPLNFTLMLVSLVVVAVLVVRRLGPTLAVVRRNPIVVATTLLVFCSIAWSYDPALSARRAGTYAIGVLLAIYLVSRFDFAGIVRILAVSTTVPGACSVIYALVDPTDAYMHGGDLEGSLRGVYAHKNQFANVMAIGFLLQLYQSAQTTRNWRHWGLAILHAELVLRAALVLQAHSAASALSVVVTTASLGLYYLWRFSRQIGAAVTAAGAALAAAVLAFSATDGDAMFAVLGRDATLTGRTDLWPLVVNEILERPWIGWGYSAFWQTGNDAMLRIWSLVGWEAPHSHNGFLEMMIDLGVLGLISTLALLAHFVLRIARGIREGVGLETWVYITFAFYTLLNNMIEITIMRIQEFAWFTFLVFYMTSGGAPAGAADDRDTAPASIAARARPLPAAGR